MFIAAAVVAVLLAAALAGSARAKLTKVPTVVKSMRTVGVPDERLWLLAIAELAGAAGLLVGLFWWPLGVVAAAGVVVYFVLAVMAHLRVGDRQVAPAAVLGLVAVAALVLRVLSV
jgi:uncharacterized membrane protein YphA (DoxX/SURF4 family)